MEKFFNVPQNLCDLFGWMLNADGSLSDAFKMEVASFLMPTGTIVSSTTLNMGSAFLQCLGQAVSRATYAALFTQIGTRYGAGDGSTTFNLPNLQGRSVIGAGSGSGLTFRDINNPLVGEEKHVQAVSELPAHSHTWASPLKRTEERGSGADVVWASLSATKESTDTTGDGVGFNVVHPSFVGFWFIKV